MPKAPGADGVGLTVMINVAGEPIQPFSVGVTTTLAVEADVPALLAVNEFIELFPEAPNPIAVLLFVQVNVAPEGLLVQEVFGTVALLQAVTLLTFADGIGLTVTE